MTRVVCAVILEEDRVFVCRRPIDKSEGGRWEFPGGKVEEGESDGEALEREILEELGIEIRVGEFLGESLGPRISLVAYLCERLENAWELREHLEARWVREVDGDQLDWAALDVPLWVKVRSLI